jgi:quercetin dioxygenase-like cupin family protein
VVTGAKEELRSGDIVWFAPGEKYWQDATATTAMSHFAIAGALDGKSVDWMENRRSIWGLNFCSRP